MLARCLRCAAGAALVLAPGLALAGNSTHPRTPVLWNDVPCMTLHDRLASPTLNIPYDISLEDTVLTPDEVEDSRTHQFFALCRTHYRHDYLPEWVTQADVDDMLASDLKDNNPVAPDRILESSAAWAGCWHRINADDERRPITFAMAEAGVDWDTSAVPAGVYSLEGYTYEPIFNVWYTRPGVVVVHDGDPHAVGPAAAFDAESLTPYRDDAPTIGGCAHVLPGTTFTASWAELVQGPPQWVEHVRDVEIAGDSFAFAFEPPPESWNKTLQFRIDLTDPQGRTFTTHAPEILSVIDRDNPAKPCVPGGSTFGDPCDDTSGGGDTTAGDGTASAPSESGAAESSSASAVPGQGGESGCACTAGGSTWPLWLACCAPLLTGRRRDRSPRDRQRAPSP